MLWAESGCMVVELSLGMHKGVQKFLFLLKMA